MCLSTWAGLSHSLFSAIAIASPFLAPATGGAICLFGPVRRITFDLTEADSDWPEGIVPGSSLVLRLGWSCSWPTALALRLVEGRGLVTLRSVDESESDERYMSIWGEGMVL